MKPKNQERRHRSDESQGIAERALIEKTPVDELQLRKKDVGKTDELRAAAKEKLLKIAGYTTEKAQAELRPVAIKAASNKAEKVLTPEEEKFLLHNLEARFTSNPDRYAIGIKWSDIKKALEAATEKQLYGIFQMEAHGHEVRVVRAIKDSNKGFRFDSSSQESPKGTRNLDYYAAEKFEEEWGIELQDQQVFKEQNKQFGINRSSSDHLKTDPETVKLGYSFCGCGGMISLNPAGNHIGFRGSLWISEA